MRYFWAILLTLFVGLPHSGSAQVADSEGRILPFPDFVSIIVPENLFSVRDEGAFSSLNREFVPEGESHAAWSENLSVMAVSPSELEYTAEDSVAELKGVLELTCSNIELSTRALSPVETESEVFCQTEEQGKLQGAPSGKSEVALYRYIQAAGATYQIRYASHEPEMFETENARAEFFTKARNVLDQVTICELASMQPCPGAYHRLNHAEVFSRAVTKYCRATAHFDCDSTVIVTAERAGSVSPTEGSGAILLVDFRDMDLGNMDILKQMMATLQLKLEDGMPWMAAVIGGSANKPLSPEERVQVGAFVSLFRSVFAQAGGAKSDSVSVTFQNFH